jgi:hypothetical protein
MTLGHIRLKVNFAESPEDQYEPRGVQARARPAKKRESAGDRMSPALSSRNVLLGKVLRAVLGQYPK